MGPDEENEWLYKPPPDISQIDGNLWMGARPVRHLPPQFHFVVCLDPQADYDLHRHQLMLRACMYDAMDEPLDGAHLARIVASVNAWCEIGPTLIHCQAGLNRSGLVTALALMSRGRTADEAMRELRAKRCDMVLCNDMFANWLRQR